MKRYSPTTDITGTPIMKEDPNGFYYSVADSPERETIDDALYFLKRSNFGLLPPDGGAEMTKESVYFEDWLRAIRDTLEQRPKKEGE